MKTDASFYVFKSVYLWISVGQASERCLLGCDVASLGKSILMFNMEHEAEYFQKQRMNKL